MTERGEGNDKGGMVSYASRVCPVSLAVFAVARPLINRTAPQRGDDGSFNFNCILNNHC